MSKTPTKGASPYDKETMRARLAEIEKKSEAIKAKSYPMREERDRVAQAARKEEDRLNAAIRKAEEGLFDIEQERAVLSRALGGRSGSDVEAEAKAASEG